MKKKKIVLIDNSEEFQKEILMEFNNDKEYSIVRKFNDGREALNYLINNQIEYDVIICDLFICEVDGITLLEKLKEKNIRKKVIVCASYKTEYISSKLSNLGVSFYLMKPIETSCIKNRVKDLFENGYCFIENLGNVQFEVTKLLLNLGVPSHLKGYSYLKEGILFVFNLAAHSYYITKDVYPVIANKYDTTVDRVERAIRHAIEVSWARGDLNLFDEIFGYSVDYDRGKPTNNEFISTVSDRLKINLKSV